VDCLGPRDPGEIVDPRPLSGVVVRPLNFTVRGHGDHLQLGMHGLWRHESSWHFRMRKVSLQRDYFSF